MPRQKQEKKLCSVEGCQKHMVAQGLCHTHYCSARKDGTITINRPDKINGGKCSVDGCDKIAISRGCCQAHYEKVKKYGNPLASYVRISGSGTKCSVEGCSNSVVSRGYCAKHYVRFRKYGNTETIGGKRAKWTEKIINDKGYVLLPIKDHPNSRKGSHNGGRIPEHRYVMSQFLGRPLFDNENIHHKNGDKTDNRIENLELWVVAQPKGQRPIDLIVYAREILQRYEKDEEKFLGMYREEIKPKLKLVV